jgi:hypothetical protein
VRSTPAALALVAGARNDFVKSRYGRGRRFKRRYKIRNCERQSVKASPGQGGTPTR